MDETLYKIGPGTGGWVTLRAVIALLELWDSDAPGTGVPSVTISKDTREPAPAAVVALEICGNVAPDTTSICRRSPGHTWPHRDQKQEGTESSSWYHEPNHL